MSKPDPIERAMEAALRPGQFIEYGASSYFLEELEDVAARIEALVRGSPERAAALYDTFIAGCHEKAEEIDDSSGSFGQFVVGLFRGWVKARRAARADRDETARRLIAWMEDDPYGFCHRLDREVMPVLDKDGRFAFERHVRERFDRQPSREQGGSGLSPERGRLRWAEVLRAVLVGRRDLEAYVELCERTELTAEDCLTIARMFEARRRPAEALEWVERGLAFEESARQSFECHDLPSMKRDLLRKLGRKEVALEDAWAEFKRRPDTFTYKELMRYVPKGKAAVWHERAMDAAVRAPLAALIELWFETGEADRLVERLRATRDEELEGLGHYAAEPAARRLARRHPDVAARVYRALGMRIVKAKKSKYYDAALANFEAARRCYEKAGLVAGWHALVEEVRASHHRKAGLMAGFEKLVAGSWPGPQPSFLERARVRWSKPPAG